MYETVDTIEYKGFEINVKSDDDALDPREWDNLGIMIVRWNDYRLGDKYDIDLEQFKRESTAKSWSAVEEHLRKELGAVIVLPLYIYEHSGLAMSTGGFSCPWDSGQAGFIYITAEKIKKEWGDNPPMASEIKQYLRAEVETYHNYISGAVYGYEVEGCEENDFNSCWGYYGTNWDENGLREAAHEVVDTELELRARREEQKRKARQRKVKAMVKYKVPLERRC